MHMQGLLLLLVLPIEGRVAQLLLLLHQAVVDQANLPLPHHFMVDQALSLHHPPRLLEVALMMFHLLAQKMMAVTLLVVETVTVLPIPVIILQLLIEGIQQKGLAEE